MPDKFPARIPSASALLAGIVLIAGLAAGCGITESPDAESATQSVQINLTGSVPPPDAQCNSEPTPSSFTVGPRDTATLSFG